MQVLFEKEICDYLSLPSIPRKKWDGKSSFEKGVATVNVGFDRMAYAVCKFDNTKDAKPRVVKVFSSERFGGIVDIFVVPSYMNTELENVDLDEKSTEKAEELLQEARELENATTKENEIKEPENEWVFDEIHNKEEAMAWIKSYNQRNKIRGHIPENEETIKMRLLAIRSDLNKKTRSK